MQGLVNRNSSLQPASPEDDSRQRTGPARWQRARLLGCEVGSVQDQESIPLPFGNLTMILESTALQRATQVIP